MRSKYMEDRFQRMLAGNPAKVKEVAAIPKVSEKQKQIQKEIKKVVVEKKKKNQLCQVKSPDCIGGPVYSHHLEGRKTKKSATDPHKIVLCCNPCNSYIEANDQWARKNDWKQSIHQPNYKRSK